MNKLQRNIMWYIWGGIAVIYGILSSIFQNTYLSVIGGLIVLIYLGVSVLISTSYSEKEKNGN